MNENHKLYVGIDSHSETHKVALIPVVALRNYPNSPIESEVIDVCNSLGDFKRLSRAIQKYAACTDEVVIGIDSCGAYTLPITYYLQRQQYQVFYMENKLKKVTRGYFFDIENKSDTIDAIRIAYLIYVRDLAGALFRTTALRSPDLDSKASILYMQVLHRQQYVKLATQSTNRLHVFLTAIFPEAEKKYFARLLRILPFYPTPREIAASRGMKKVQGVGKATKAVIKELAKETAGISADNYRSLILHLLRQRQQAMTWEQEITEALEKGVDEHPYGAILLSFPGIGTITAATIIGVVGDIRRWSSDKKLKKAFGLYGTFQESGKSRGVRKQGLGGNRLCKAALFRVTMLCLIDRFPENDFRDYYLRKVSKGKPKMSAIVATMGKLTEIIYHCVQAGETYQYRGTYKLSRRGRKRISAEI